ncbi:unnamed protein product [Closterium sp. NIES-53]
MSQKIANARDVIFYERLFLKQFREDEQVSVNRVYANEGHSYATPEDEAAAAIPEQDTRGGFTRGDRRDSDDDNDDSPGGGAGAAGRSKSDRSAAPPARLEPDTDDDDVQEVIPQHRQDSTVTGLRLLGLHTATSTAPRVIEPKNSRQALTGPHSKEWRKVMDAEIKALASRDTWVLVDRAAIKGKIILFEKWVFRVKTAADGTIERFKARWVVRGYDQRHGIEFDQTFAPVSRHTSAPRLWQQYLHNILLEIGFKQMPHDLGMYRRDSRGEYILLTIYVDDLLYTGSSKKLLEQFEKNRAGRVDITCNHDMKQFLGLNITYSQKPFISQQPSMQKNLANASTSRLHHSPPLTAFQDPITSLTTKPCPPLGYQQQLGCLLFASVTCRPDLSCIPSQLAQYSRKPTAESLLDLQRALQFFISTPNVELCYSTIPTASFNLIGYVDADHAADPENRRSRTGFLFRLERSGPITWNSQKQELVALSSAEAGFIAATAAVREGLHLQELLQDVGLRISALGSLQRIG